MGRSRQVVQAMVGACILAACGGRSDVIDGYGPFIGGDDVGLDAAYDGSPREAGPVCPPGKNLCKGACFPDSPDLCGPSCTLCPRHAHVKSPSCVDGQCLYECEEGFQPCEAGCCGPRVLDISAGGHHTCALDESGAVYCWGANGAGELGNHSSIDQPSPVAVQLLPPAKAIAAGAQHTCAIANPDKTYCWGSNGYSQLGTGKPTGYAQPPDDPSAGTTLLAAGDCSTCAVIDGITRCWGCVGVNEKAGVWSTTLKAVPGLAPKEVTVLRVGTHMACARTTSGAAKCWGNNLHGALGDGTEIGTATAKIVNGLASDVTNIAAGQERACAMLSSGELRCWGYNPNGELRAFLGLDSAVLPIPVRDMPGPVLDVALLDDGGCVLVEGGKVFCWIRDGEVTEVALPSRAVRVVSGDVHTCALLENHRVACWGNNGYGTLGAGTFGKSDTPVLVDGL